jgi:predicted DNA binding CopG/RHH family protein
MPDSKIDYSDIPESTDEELRRATRVGRPKSAKTKQLIAIRLDPVLIGRLKKLAKTQDIPYQTLIHQLLQEAIDEVA